MKQIRVQETQHVLAEGRQAIIPLRDDDKDKNKDDQGGDYGSSAYQL